MTLDQFNKLRQGDKVSTRGIIGKVYQCDFNAMRVSITVELPLRRRGQRSRINYQNVNLVATPENPLCQQEN